MTTLDKYLKYETSYINRQTTSSTDTWKTYTWQEIAIPIRKKIKKTEYKGEYPIVKKISFDSGEIVLREERKTKTDLYLALPKTLIVSKINLHQGAVAINNLGWITCTTHYDVYKINEKIVDIKFLWYYLRSPVFRKKIYDDLKYRGIKKEANYKYLKNIKLKLPPIEEQRKIVYILDTIRHAIEVQDRLLDTLNELKRALMNRLFTKGLDSNQPTKQTEIGEIPAHWKVVKLEEILSKRNETILPREAQKLGLIYVGLEHIDSGTPFLYRWDSPSKVKSLKNRFYPGDILYGKLRPYLDKAVIAEYEGVCSTDILVLKVIRIKANPYFAVYLLHTDRFLKYATSSMKGVNHPRVTWNDIREFKVALPLLDEQEKIASIMIKIDEKIKLIRQKKNLLEELFSSLLHKLMSGQIRVTNLNEIYSSKRPSGV